MDKFIKREKLAPILDKLDRKEYIAIIGPRQAGKTTMLDRIGEILLDRVDIDVDQVHKFTFQDPEILSSFEQDPVKYIQSQIISETKRSYFLIDEYQYAKKGGEQLKLLYDTISNVKVIITGSSSLELRQISSCMVGRILQYELRQLEYSEMISATNNVLAKAYKKNTDYTISQISGAEVEKPYIASNTLRDAQRMFDTYTRFGSYPEVFLAESDKVKEELLLNIYNTYVEKDLIRLLNIGSFDKFFKLIKYLSLTIGQLANINSICRDLDMSYEEVSSMLEKLEQTYIIKRIKPYFSNEVNAIKKMPIVYFCDTGFRNWAIRNFSDVENRSDAGHLIENIVLKRLIQLVEDSVELTEVRYWRTKSGAEVDFVLEKLGEHPDQIPLEVKYRKFKEPKITRAYRSFLQKYQPSIGIIITKDFSGRKKFENTEVIFIPVALF